MSLDWGLELGSDVTSHELAAIICSVLGRAADSYTVKEHGIEIDTGTLGFGTFVHRYDAEDWAGPPGPSPVEETYGFDPKILVDFDLYSYDRDTEKTIAGVCLEILRRLRGDAVLLRNGELPVLLRKDGELVLNSEDDSWAYYADTGGVVGMPHVSRPLPAI